MYKIISNDGTITAIINSASYTIGRNHVAYEQIVKAVREDDEAEFVRLANMKPEERVRDFLSSVADRSQGRAEIRDGNVYYNGQQLHNVLARRTVELCQQGFSPDGMLRFIDNLMQNPSSRAVNELYSFLEHRGLPITDDGCFLAYKTIRKDWMDKYSGTISNHIGAKPKMQRNMVDDDHSNHCSKGLHVGALTYAGPGGWYNSPDDRVVIVKVNPKDAVSVPTDHGFTKLRVCEYEVIAEFKGELSRAQYGHSTNDAWEDEDWDDDCYEEDCDLVEDFINEIDVFDLEDDMEISFMYDGERRYAVLNDCSNSEYVNATLIYPEAHSGEYRNFKWRKMLDCRLLSDF